MNTRQLSNSTQHGVNFIYAICSEEGETSGRLGRLAGVDSVSKISPNDIWIMRAYSGEKSGDTLGFQNWVRDFSATS